MDPTDPYDKLQAARLASAAVNSKNAVDRGNMLGKLHQETGKNVANEMVSSTLKKFGKAGKRSKKQRKLKAKKRKTSRR